MENIKLDDLKHIPEISWYNHNYYILNNKLIYAESDDDNTTEIYEIDFIHMEQKYIGYCYTSENNIIHFDKEKGEKYGYKGINVSKT